jgi:hypothetical protein
VEEEGKRRRKKAGGREMRKPRGSSKGTVRCRARSSRPDRARGGCGAKAGGSEAADEVESLAAVAGAREEVVGYSLGDETEGTVGGRGEVESIQLRVLNLFR